MHFLLSKLVYIRPFPASDLKKLFAHFFFLLSIITILKREKKNRRDYLYVSANIEGKTIVPFERNSKNGFGKKSRHIK